MRPATAGEDVVYFFRAAFGFADFAAGFFVAAFFFADGFFVEPRWKISSHPAANFSVEPVWTV
jgi:hypothetical protein